MSTSAATSLKALRGLARQTGGARNLHMTGAAAQPRLPLDKYRRQESEASKTPATTSSSQSSRPFNTSRALKTVADSSPIDFAYLPTFPVPELEYDSVNNISRVPMLPAYSPAAAPTIAEASAALYSHTPILKPTISLTAGEATHIHAPSAMSDVHDGGQHEATDFHDVVATLASGAESVRQTVLDGGSAEVDKARGALTNAWAGLMEDVFGPKAAVSRA